MICTLHTPIGPFPEFTECLPTYRDYLPTKMIFIKLFETSIKKHGLFRRDLRSTNEKKK